MKVESQHEPSIGSPTLAPIEVLKGTSALAELKPIWNELLKSSDANTIFLTWEWAASWWQAFGSAFELVALRCMDSNGQAVGIAPFFRVRERMGLGISGFCLYLLGDVTGGSEKLDWIVRDGWEKPVVGAVLNWLESSAL